MAQTTRGLIVVIKADTRQLRRQLALARISLERSFWRRLLLRVEVWRINREDAP